MDIIATNESPSQVSDKIKDLLFSKSAERLENMRSAVASQLFGENESEEETDETEDEYEDEYEEDENEDN